MAKRRTDRRRREGFISRIKVQAGGYGNALYIDHPNGYTTVYAHLQEYAPLIEALVKKNQYTKESFELDLSFKPEELPVTKGRSSAMADIRLTAGDDTYVQPAADKNTFNNVYGEAGNDSIRMYQGGAHGGPGNDRFEQIADPTIPIACSWLLTGARVTT